MNQRQNLASEATYAQCGRQHFHPTFTVAISAGSMVSAWPTERHHPERKAKVTNVHPESTNHPSDGRATEQTSFSSGEKSLGVPSAARGAGGGGCLCSHRSP